MPQCPVCNDELSIEHRNGVEIDECKNHGLWLDKGELYQITESERHKPNTWDFASIFRTFQRPFVHEDRTLSCPHCQEELKEIPYEGVTIDWCPEHGVWFDSGELEALLNNLKLDRHYLSKVTLRTFEMKF